MHNNVVVFLTVYTEIISDNFLAYSYTSSLLIVSVTRNLIFTESSTFVEAEEAQFLDNSPGSDLGAISNLPRHLQPNLYNLLPL